MDKAEHALTGTRDDVSHQDGDIGREYIQLSQQWLYAVRVGEDTNRYARLLADVEQVALNTALNDDVKRKTFWINIYNAVVQMALQSDPEVWQHRNRFFASKRLSIAGTRLSLDDVEHGILRRSKNKWSLGYLNKLIVGQFEKTFRVAALDYRIHFALNCGARSCPPIAFYAEEKIEAQLRDAMIGYLTTETLYDALQNRVTVPAFMGWFRGDFGGIAGIQALLRDSGVIPLNSSPRIDFAPYNWQPYLNNFTT
jgi:hypothetical protein